MEEHKRRFSIRVILSVVAILIAVSIAIVLVPFFLNVSGGVSGNPADWGSFGSYFGGTLATVVSMISLIAVIYTVYLQREILESTQNFSSKTIEQQSDLISSSENFNRYSLIENHRQRAVRYLESQVAYVTGEINRIADSMNSLSFTNSKIYLPEEKQRLMSRFVEERAKLEEKLQLLNVSTLMLSVDKFESIEKIDFIFVKAIKDCMGFDFQVRGTE